MSNKTTAFKQTEVGLIPSDWEVYFLGNLLKGIADVDHYMPKTEKYGVPYVMTGDLKDYAGEIDFDSCKKISYDDYEKLSKKVRNVKGDIILARYATVGTVSYVNIDFDFVVSYSCVTIKPDKSRLIDLFLYYYFKSHIFRLEVKNKVNANIQDNVGIGDLVKMQIPLPPTKSEQTAIATALSDADALISSLEKLIAKKRNIKQGAMQKLLQPKEGWEVKKLGDLTKVFTKQTGFDYTAYIKPSLVQYRTDDTIPFIQNKDFNNRWINFDTDYFIPKNIAIQFPKILLNEKSLLISISGSVGNVGLFDSQELAFIGGAVAILKFKDPDLIDWVMFYLKSVDGQKKLLDNVKAGSHQNLILDDIRKIEIVFPPKEEQTRIDTILSDMDAEITALETKLEKYKKVKLGMMQNLLTGRIRLI